MFSKVIKFIHFNFHKPIKYTLFDSIIKILGLSMLYHFCMKPNVPAVWPVGGLYAQEFVDSYFVYLSCFLF